MDDKQQTLIIWLAVLLLFRCFFTNSYPVYGWLFMREHTTLTTQPIHCAVALLGLWRMAVEKVLRHYQRHAVEMASSILLWCKILTDGMPCGPCMSSATSFIRPSFIRHLVYPVLPKGKKKSKFKGQIYCTCAVQLLSFFAAVLSAFRDYHGSCNESTPLCRRGAL